MLIYFFTAFLLDLVDLPLAVSSIPVTLLPASAAPVTAPSAAPLAAPANTAFNASLALSKSPVAFLPDFLAAPFVLTVFFWDFLAAGLFALFEADLLEPFFAGFLVGMIIPSLEI